MSANRPECFERGMTFMGEPEEPIIRAYVESLEKSVVELLRVVDEGLMPNINRCFNIDFQLLNESQIRARKLV